MDLSVKTLISSLAGHLLAGSSPFETYVPHSKQNLYYNLNLLSELGDVTSASFEPLRSEIAAENEELLSQQQRAAESLPPKTPHEEAAFTRPEQKQAAPIQKQGSLSKRSREVDQSLIEALQNLRDSRHFQRKTMGVYSPILRGNT